MSPAKKKGIMSMLEDSLPLLDDNHTYGCVARPLCIEKDGRPVCADHQRLPDGSYIKKGKNDVYRDSISDPSSRAFKCRSLVPLVFRRQRKTSNFICWKCLGRIKNYMGPGKQGAPTFSAPGR